MEHAPFCERDIKRPQNLETHDEHGDFKILIKKEGLIYPYIYGTHPFDFVGWDGYHYPWAVSIGLNDSTINKRLFASLKCN